MENNIYIKGFDKNLRCRDYQFEIGKEYKIETDTKLKLCSDTVFHFCESIQQVHGFYNVDDDNRFCEIEVLGGIVKDDKKCGSNHIKILREIKGSELKKLIGKTNKNTGIFNTGNRNTGDWNTGNWNTGNWNTGNNNTGDWNTGNWNTGDWNTGDWNTGDWNTGNYNTGNWNTGNCNTGDWNTCNHSNGFFNSKESNVYIFNKDSNLKYREFINSKFYDALQSVPFVLTKWMHYTEDEKKDSVIRQCIGGYLKEYTYEEACNNWWNNMSIENKEIVMQIPNFDKSVFEEITGIKITEGDK